MESFNKYISEYKKQIEKGDIVKAYRGLMCYIMDLRNYLSNRYTDYSVSGSLYFGYMDMTYFSFTPVDLRERKLKVALVFIHDKIRWEIWLAGNNKQIQANYSRLFQERGWNKYPISPSGKGVDSIIEYVLVDKPDFDDLDTLTAKIEAGALKFTRDIQNFLAE